MEKQKVKDYIVKNFEWLQELYNEQERKGVIYQYEKNEEWTKKVIIEKHSFDKKIASDFNISKDSRRKILSDFAKCFRWYERFVESWNELCHNEFDRYCLITEQNLNSLIK